jgi:membrane dipeptidase
LAFGRLIGMLQAQRMPTITTRAGLRAGVPSAIIAAEGGDFLDGRPDRVDETYTKWSLRHLQLTHYRVNELGDIQTEPPVHSGLTDTGAEVIRRCNKLGIVVDVARGTFELVQRAVSVTTKPLVGPSTFPDYDRLPDLADALAHAGFSPADSAKILGGNYARVFEACMTS